MKKYFSIFLTFIIINCNFSYALVNDDFVLQTLNKNLKIKEYKVELVKDDLIDKEFVFKYKNEKYPKMSVMTDDLVNSTLYKYKNQKLITYTPIDFSKLEKISVKLKPINYITTRNKTLKEGNNIEFVLVQDFFLNKKLYKKGTKINARIENIILNQAYGLPARIEIGDFRIDNTKLDGILTQQGANRALWVIPTGYIISAFFGVGFLIYPIRGGHAKLKQEKTYFLDINVVNL